jgi:hypothetical protein
LTAEAYLELARCARKQGDHKAAYGSWLRAAQVAEELQRDDLTAETCQQGGLISQLAGDPARARELHWQALNLAARIGDQDAMIASCRDLGRLARWKRDEGHESPEY